MNKKELTIEQKYVIVANAHIQANRRIKEKKAYRESINQLIKPYNGKMEDTNK